MPSGGELVVLLRRLDALEDAIRHREWEQVEFIYDQVRSAAERAAGTRTRPYDAEGVRG